MHVIFETIQKHKSIPLKHWDYCKVSSWAVNLPGICVIEESITKIEASISKIEKSMSLRMSEVEELVVIIKDSISNIIKILKWSDT